MDEQYRIHGRTIRIYGRTIRIHMQTPSPHSSLQLTGNTYGCSLIFKYFDCTRRANSSCNISLIIQYFRHAEFSLHICWTAIVRLCRCLYTYSLNENGLKWWFHSILSPTCLKIWISVNLVAGGIGSGYISQFCRMSKLVSWL